MNGLSLHCGSNEVERNQLALVPTPKATETWYPIPHTVLLDQVEETLQHNGLKIVNEAHALGHEGNRYFGLLEVQSGDNVHDFSLVVGVRNSHDQTFPAGLVIGSRVFLVAQAGSAPSAPGFTNFPLAVCFAGAFTCPVRPDKRLESQTVRCRAWPRPGA